MDDTTSCDMMPAATETVFGSHVLTIDEYTKTTAELAIDEIIKSERFRIGGHSWHIEWCPRRKDEEGVEWVSLFLCFDHHNEEVKVKATPEFSLLDRDGKKTIQSFGFRCWPQHTFSSKSEDTLAWGTTEFIQTKALESYLLIQDDDCCRIRCDVNVSVIREPPPPPSSDLGDLLLGSEVGRDVTFLVDDEHFTAHKCVLAARTSTAFMAEVVAGKEIAGGSRHVLVVDGVKPWVFKALLHFVYTNTLPDVEDDQGDLDVHVHARGDLLAAAHRYGMERLKMVCTDVLCSHIYPHTALHLLNLSQRHGCLKLNQACVEYISKTLNCYNMEKRNR